MTASSDANREKIKYISCGSCRLWFLAPKEVIFVSCPQCDAINNCGPPRVSNIVSIVKPLTSS